MSRQLIVARRLIAFGLHVSRSDYPSDAYSFDERYTVLTMSIRGSSPMMPMSAISTISAQCIVCVCVYSLSCVRLSCFSWRVLALILPLVESLWGGEQKKHTIIIIVYCVR